VLWLTERPVVVQHEWDANNPEDPVFLVQPDGGLGIGYQPPCTPSSKSALQQPFTEQQTRNSRGRLAALRSCACMAAPAGDENEAQSPSSDEQDNNGTVSLSITASRSEARDRSRSAQVRNTPQSKKGALLLPCTNVPRQ
jgi:hypothetical protein